MNHIEYSEIKKHLSLEHKMEEQEKVIDAFRRVKSGKTISLNDLQLIQRTLNEHFKAGFYDREINLSDTLFILEHQNHLTKDNVNRSKRKLKKRGLDLNRLRRQRRLQHEKQYQQERENF